MKKIVIIQYYENQMWVFGIFSTWQNAYTNLMQYVMAEDFGGYADNVRQFTKNARAGHSFSRQNKVYMNFENDGSGMIPDNADYVINDETFVVQEVDLSKTYPRTTMGIGMPWDRLVA